MTNIYTILDEVAETYSTPFFQGNDALAERSFDQLTNSDDTIVYANPTDFRLYRIATFDDKTGVIVAEEKPQLIKHGQSR